ncbi:MAG: alpha-amylase, partial [Prevotellaceae bacterium]|nr:alpha-amylase [Prevotellaceae bacterium]
TLPLGAADDTTQAFAPHNNFYYIPNTEFHGQFDLTDGAPAPYREYPAKATGNDRFDAYPTANDWYETAKLNYGVDYLNNCTPHFTPTPDTWQKMLDILLFWASKHIDAFRCDMAEMVPVAFWEWAIPRVKQHYPALLFIAEVYNPAQYRDYLTRGRFDYLYDKVGLYDTLRNIVCGYESATAITRAWQSLGGIEKQMLNFLENHDEQRIASRFFANNAPCAIPALMVAAMINTNPVMIYFGQELGEPGMECEGFSGCDGRTTIFDYWSINSIRNWRNGGAFDGQQLTGEQKDLQAAYRRILNLCLTEKAISEGLFFDLMYANMGGWRFNERRQYAFLRKAGNELLLIVANFDTVDVDIALNLPAHAFDYLKMAPQKSCQATDLLTGKQETISLLPNQATETTVSAQNGKVLKIRTE